AAARAVCGPDQGNDLRIHRQTMACEKSAMARAIADVQIALRGTTGPSVALNTN
ncbi:MAG: hypothetical protein JWO81_1526, partial [Alphaproteobacteria bacterium]|nr:hypothetical protein [Alphaproteobacteria bacterium]